MRKGLGTAVALLGVLAAPTILEAQRTAARQAPAASGPKHEFGVDFGIGYRKSSGSDGGLVLGTPVDVRLGFVAQGPMSFEGRLTLALDGTGGVTAYSFDPGVNLLYRLGQGTMQRNKYLTVGLDVNVVDNGANSGAIFGINGGVGMRKPYGSGAWRFELFGAYDFEQTTVGEPGTFTVGLRLGLSLWH